MAILVGRRCDLELRMCGRIVRNDARGPLSRLSITSSEWRESIQGITLSSPQSADTSPLALEEVEIVCERLRECNPARIFPLEIWWITGQGIGSLLQRGASG